MHYFMQLNCRNRCFKMAKILLKFFERNYNILHEQSPRKISFLTEENNRSIFDLSPTNSETGKRHKENISPIRKATEVVSTPIHRRPRLPRKYLSVDASGKECSETETADFLQKKIFSHNASVSMSNPSDDVSATTDKVFVTPRVSKSPKTTDSPDTENKESPRSAETVAMLINLNVDEDKASKREEVNKTADISNSKLSNSPHQIASISTPNSQISNSPHQIADISTPNSELSNSPHQIADISTPNSELSNSPHQIADISTPNSQLSISPHQRVDILQDSVCIGEEINLFTNVKYSESPIKRSKISCYPDRNIQILASPTERAEMIAQDTKIADFSAKGNTTNRSPVECGKIIATTDVKRKYPSPRSNKFIKIMPRLISSDGGNELDIEFPWESVESPSPTSRNNSPRDYKHNETVNTSKGESSLDDNIRSALLNESTSKTSPNIFEPQISPCEKRTSTDSFQKNQSGCIPLKSISPSAIYSKETSSPKFIEHQVSPLKSATGLHYNLVKTISPGADKEDRQTSSTGISPSSRPSSPKVSLKNTESQISPSEKVYFDFHQYATKQNRSPKSTLSPSVSPQEAAATSGQCSINVNPKALESSDNNVINWFIHKLNKLSSLGDECMNDVFEKITEFQKELQFLFLYVKKIAHVEKILNKVNVTEDFKNVTSELAARAPELAEKLNLWKSAGDSEIQAWIKSFEDIKSIKNNYETSLNSDSSPVDCMRLLRAYEYNLKSVWKKMIDMKNLEDTRRSLLLKASFDFEKLIKKFVKCLLIVGIVKPRTETVST